MVQWTTIVRYLSFIIGGRNLDVLQTWDSDTLVFREYVFVSYTGQRGRSTTSLYFASRVS